MPLKRAKIRLFIEADLSAGASVRLAGLQYHYLTRVMRLETGSTVGMFNGRDGEWRARLAETGKNSCFLTVETHLAPQMVEEGPWLIFAPLKKGPTDFLVEKAVELGVSRLVPIQTRFTASVRINKRRLRANAIEAAEQCGRLTVPPIADVVRMERFISAWPAERPLLVLDETGNGRPLADIFDVNYEANLKPPAVMCGPEGGFATDELDALGNLPFATRVGLGPRILRAESAALSALACWQIMRGDGWQAPAAKAARR
jgi:16S rRNA (uracil1498-N3)-methyltransferase